MEINKPFDSNTINVIAPAKINLHLEVLGIRSDGFHELAMVMQSINLFDNIEMKLIPSGDIKLIITNSDLTTGGENLIFKAAKLIKEKFGSIHLGVEINLIKNIPIGAGLAGGSSDAAATLIGLNHLWGLGCNQNELELMASELGSDAPFCIAGGTQLCFGRGEVLERVVIEDPDLSILLVKDPKVSVSTPWAYNLYKEKYGTNYLHNEEDYKSIRNNVRESSWLKKFDMLNLPPFKNDLQQVVEPLIPSVQNSLRLLSSIPECLAVSMSGSGPSCFAIFPSKEGASIALKDNLSIIKSAGLDAWACGFYRNGASLKL